MITMRWRRRSDSGRRSSSCIALLHAPSRNDARGFRFFNVHKQATDYDPQAEFIRH